MPKQLNVSLTVDADVERAKKKILDLQKSLEKVATAIPKNSKELFNTKALNEASQAALELEKHLRAAVDVNTGKLNLSSFASSLQASGHTLDEYRQKLEAIGTDGSEAFLKLSYNIATAEAPVRRVNATMQNFLTTLKNTARWQISSSILHGFIGAVQSAYSYAQNLNESLNNIRIVTGQSSEQMAEFANRANRAAQALSTTTVRYTDAALIYYQQGIRDQEEIAKRTDTTIKMMNVSGQSAEEASSQMTAIWNNFYDGSKSLEFYADAITALGAATASSSEEIATGIEKFAAVAETVGLSYEYATAALATITAQTRQSADTVGTSLRTLFSRLEGLKLGETLEDGVDLNKYSAALKTIGVDILDVNGELKNMDTILDETAAHWDTLSNAQQVAFAQTVGGVRQYTNLIALMDNWDKMQQNVQIAQNSEGTLQQQADIYAESWEAASTRVRAAMENIYSQLLNDKFFIQLNNGLAGFLQGISGAIKGMGGLKGILLTVGNIIAQKYAKEIPTVLNNMKQSFMQISGQAQKMALEMQKMNLNSLADFAKKSLDNATKGTGSLATAAEAQAYEQLAQARMEYNIKNKTYSEEERAAAEAELQVLELKGKALVDQGAKYDKLKADVEELQANLILMSKTDGTEILTLYDKMFSFGQAKTGIQEVITALDQGKISAVDAISSITKYGETLKTSFNDSNEIENLMNKIKNAILYGTEPIEPLITQLNRLKGVSADSFESLSKDTNIPVEKLRTLASLAEQAGIKFDDFIKRLKDGGNSFKGFNNHGVKTSEVIMSATGALMQFSAALNAIQRIKDVFSDEDATAVEKIGAVVGLLMSTMMSFNAVSKFTNLLIEKGVLAKLKDAVASKAAAAGNSALLASLGPIAIVAAALAAALFLVVAAIEAITAGIKYQENQSIEKKMERAAEASKEFKDALEEVQNKIDELAEAKENFETLQQTLSNCAVGSDEWSEALKNVNAEIRNLIQQYPELAKYVSRDSEGNYELDEAGWDAAEALYSRQESTLQLAAYGSNLLSQKYQLQLDQEDITNQLNQAVQNSEASFTLVGRNGADYDYSTNGLLYYSGLTNKELTLRNQNTGYFAKEDAANLLSTGENIGNVFIDYLRNNTDILNTFLTSSLDQQRQMFLNYLQNNEDFRENKLNSGYKNVKFQLQSGAESEQQETVDQISATNDFLATITPLLQEEQQLIQDQAEIEKQQSIATLDKLLEQTNLLGDSKYAGQIATILGSAYGDNFLQAFQDSLDSIEDGSYKLFKGWEGSKDAEKAVAEYLKLIGQDIVAGSLKLTTGENGQNVAKFKKKNADGTWDTEETTVDADYIASLLAASDIFDQLTVSAQAVDAVFQELGKSDSGKALIDYFGNPSSDNRFSGASKQQLLDIQDIINTTDRRAGAKGILTKLGLDPDLISEMTGQTAQEIVSQLIHDVDESLSHIENFTDENQDGLLRGFVGKYYEKLINIADQEGNEIQTAIATKMGEIFSQGGTSALDLFTEFLNQDALKDVNLDNLTLAFKELDFSNPESLNLFKDGLSNLGVEIDDINFDNLEALIEQLNKLASVKGFDQLVEEFSSVVDIINDLELGNEISEDDYQALIDYNSEWKDLFLTVAGGKHKFVGDVKNMTSGALESLEKQRDELTELTTDQQKFFENYEELTDNNVFDFLTKTDEGLSLAKIAGFSDEDIQNLEQGSDDCKDIIDAIIALLELNIGEENNILDNIVASTATSIDEIKQLYIDGKISTWAIAQQWIDYFQQVADEAAKSALETAESWNDIRKALADAPELEGSLEHQAAVTRVGRENILSAETYQQARGAYNTAVNEGDASAYSDYLYQTGEILKKNVEAAKSFEELDAALKEYEEETKNSAENWNDVKEKYQDIADTSIAASKSIKELKEKMDEVSSKGLDVNTESVQTALAGMNLSTKEVLDNLELFTSYDDAVTHIVLDIEGAKDLKDVLDILNQVTAHDGANISLSMLDAANKNIHEQLQTQLTPEQTPGEQMASISQSVSTEIAELMHTGIPALQEYAQQLQTSLDQFNAETPAALINTAESLEGVFDIINNLEDTQIDAALINQEHVYGLISSTEQLAQLWNLGFQDGNAYAEGLIHIAEQYDNTAAELEKYNQALQNYKNNSSEANEAALGQAEYNLELATRAGEAAAAYDLEADAVEDIAREFAATDTVLKENAELAADAATRYLRLNRGLEDLQDSYDEVCDVIGDLEKGLGREVRAADKSAKAFKTLRKGLADILDTTEDVIDAFGDDWIKDNAEDIKKAINGDIDAIHRLQQAAGDEIQVEVGINDNGAFDEFQQKIAEAEEGADLTLDVDTNAYLQNLVWAMQMAGMTQEDIEAKLGAMGVDVDLEPMAASLNDMAAMAAEAGVAVSDNFAANAGIDTEVESSTDTQTDTTTQMGYIPHVSWKTETRQSHFAVQGEGNNLESKDVPTTVNTPIVTYEPQPQTNTADKQTTQQALKVKGATKSSGGHVSSKNTGGGGGGRGGGGGGGGKERQAKEASKFSPKTPERYHVVTKKLTALSAAQDRLSKKQSTLFGKDYLNSIDATNKLLQKNLNLIQEESDEIDRWLKVDKEKMETYGAIFDEEGTILNYEEIFNREADKVKAVYDAEKELIDRWNAGDESITEEMLEQAKKNIEDAEEAFGEFEEALSQYEDTIQKQQENWAKRQEAIIAIQENRYEKIATQLEYQLDIQERSLKILNYYYDKLSDNVYKAAEALRYIYSLNGTDQFDVAFNKLAAYKNTTDALTNEYNTPLYDENGNKLSDHSITEANYAEGLQNAIDGVLENLTSINEAIRTMQEYYANTLSDVISKISLYTDHMEHLTTVLEHYNTILNLTGQSKAYDKINTILKGQAKTIENTLDADKATYEMLKRQSDLQKAELEAVWADPNHTTNQLILAENEYFAALQAMDEAHEKMLDSAEAFAEKLQEIYQNDVAKAYEGLEDSITDGMGFDLLNDSLSRLSSLDDEWLTKTNQIYETSSLIKDINKAIDDSTNAATKQKLKLFADEIDALKEKDRLSKFELDLAKARYSLLQAQIALEDAQNAKSTVRLRRDNEGNYGYVYTADQNAVNDAEGDLLAAENDLYNMKLNAANEYGQKVIQARQELAEKLKEIDDDLELDEAERNERKALAQKEYFDLIETYSYIYGVATSDDARVVDDAWITTYDDIIRSGGDYKDDIVVYNKDVTDSWNNMFDEINKKMKEVVPELLGNSEGGYGLAELQTAVDDLTTESDEFKTLLTEDVIPALEQELINVDATTQAFSDQLPTIEDMQTYYEKLAQDLNAALNELIALNGTELQDKTATYTINHVDNYFTNNIPTDSTSTSTTYPSGSDSGGPGGGTGGTPSGSNMIKSSKPLSTEVRPYSNPNYSYNLVNIHGKRFDTGGYTGSWENGSKLAWLDQKELVLNAQDTENMLMTVSAIRDLNNSINLQALYSTLASGLVAGVYQSAAQALEQQVSITATFPSVTDHNEIEEALNSLVNRASQYANRYN